MTRLLYIDSLRGIASLAVAIFWHYSHFSSSFQTNSVGSIPPLYWLLPVRFFYDYGDVMVDLFFVLSGVVFSYTYLDLVKSRKITGYNFFIKRFSRLYPIHFITLILTVILLTMFHSITGKFPIYTINDSYHFILNVLFLQKGFADHGYSFNAPSWSLSIEALMYLLFFLQARYANVIYTSVFLVIIGLIFYRLPYDLTFLINHPVARGLMGFFTGCLLHVILIKNGLYRKYRLPIITIYVLSASFYFIYVQYHFNIQSHLMMIFFSVIIITEIHYNKYLRRLLENKVFKTLGDISLSLYLIHIPIQMTILFYFKISHLVIFYDSYWLFLVYSIGVILFGWLLHISIENPAQTWIRFRFSKQNSINKD